MKTAVIILGVFAGCVWYGMTTVLWLSERYPAALVSFCGTVLWWAIAAHVYHKRVSFITDYRDDTQSS